MQALDVRAERRAQSLDHTDGIPLDQARRRLSIGPYAPFHPDPCIRFALPPSIWLKPLPSHEQVFAHTGVSCERYECPAAANARRLRRLEQQGIDLMQAPSRAVKEGIPEAPRASDLCAAQMVEVLRHAHATGTAVDRLHGRR